MKTYVWLLLVHTLAVQELVTAEEDEGLVDRVFLTKIASSPGPPQAITRTGTAC